MEGHAHVAEPGVVAVEQTAVEGTTRAERRHAGDVPPVLEPRRGGVAERFASRLGDPHPIVAFLVALVSGYLVLAAVSIALGFLVTDVVLAVGAVERLDERFAAWLAGARTEAWTDVSWVGSELAGGYVIPAVIGVVVVAMVALRRWRIAVYVLFGVAVESATYRATTLFVERRRPEVERLESLPVDASYPSGHTAASVALYSGLALLLTSRWARGPWRFAIWAVALAIPPFVALSRIYRGMHHPVDTLAGVLIGIAALVVVVFACRVAGAAVARRVAEEAR